MIFREVYLRSLLDEALAQVPTPQDCGIVLEGSIAEGFGNESSDVDFLVISDGDEQFRQTPTILFIDGRKVDVRIRSAQEVRADIDTLLHLYDKGRPAPTELLNRCQRFHHAVVFGHGSFIDSLRAPLSIPQLNAIVADHFARQCRWAARFAIAMLFLEQPSLAVNWVRTALEHAAKFWAATRGETYLEGRWIFQQLARIDGGGQVATSYRELRSRSESLPQPTMASYVTETLSLIKTLGIEGCDPDPGNLVLERQPGVTSWQIHSTLHVLRGRQDVLALNPDAAAVWGRLVFGLPLPEVLERLDGDGSSARFVADFHTFGMIRMRWRDGHWIDAPPTTLIPSAHRPLLTIAGAVVTDDEPLQLLPIPASRFAAAGMALSHGTVMVESVRRDAVGAIASEQWGVFETVARRMMRHACLTILSAHGIDPPPAPEQVCDRLQTLRGLDKEILDRIPALERSIPTNTRSHAEEVLRQLDEFTHATRRITGTGRFGVSFEGTEGWSNTLRGLGDWVRVGAYLDARFPHAGLRELLQPVQPVRSNGNGSRVPRLYARRTVDAST